MTRLRQIDRVRAMLATAGAEGVTNGEFIEAGLYKFSARIGDLRGQGYAIRHERLSEGRHRYTLTGRPAVPRDPDPEPAVESQSEPEVEQASLFDAGRPTPRSAILGDDA